MSATLAPTGQHRLIGHALCERPVAVGLDELEAIVDEQDLVERAHTAALPVVKAALRSSTHYKLLAGSGGANEWVRREAAPIARVIAEGMLSTLREAVAGVQP